MVRKSRSQNDAELWISPPCFLFPSGYTRWSQSFWIGYYLRGRATNTWVGSDQQVKLRRSFQSLFLAKREFLYITGKHNLLSGQPQTKQAHSSPSHWARFPVPSTKEVRPSQRDSHCIGYGLLPRRWTLHVAASKEEVLDKRSPVLRSLDSLRTRSPPYG